jgi:cyclic beta-1,2-glucan synthetase
VEAHTAISVSPEDDVELRRITLRNRTGETRMIELTSYAEVVLAPLAADAAHPAFSNLFVQTEFARESSAILCTRRARTAEEHPPWLLHLMVVPGGETVGELSCETDRARFIGRGRSTARPAALHTVAPLSNTAGSVLDPDRRPAAHGNPRSLCHCGGDVVWAELKAGTPRLVSSTSTSTPAWSTGPSISPGRTAR